jgi:hypothetical protein
MPAFHRSIAIAIAAAITLGSDALAFDPARDVQGNGVPVPPQSPLPPLQLSDQQRAQVSKAVRIDHTEIAPTGKAAEFEPSVGAQVPAGIELNPLPRPLVYDIPILKQYSYVKLKGRVLIVNALTRAIVDMFPEG